MDEAQQHKEIQKGFNAGYLMEKLNPELARKLREPLQIKYQAEYNPLLNRYDN